MIRSIWNIIKRWFSNPHIHRWVDAKPDPEFRMYSDSLMDYQYRNWACVKCGKVNLCLDRHIEKCKRREADKRTANEIVERVKRKP